MFVCCAPASAVIWSRFCDGSRLPCVFLVCLLLLLVFVLCSPVLCAGEAITGAQTQRAARTRRTVASLAPAAPSCCASRQQSRLMMRNQGP